MTWRSHGRASVDTDSPQAFAVCDRCGFQYNRVELHWDRQWAGTRIINRQLLVCDDCQDIPNPQLRAFKLPADPVPISDPRIELSEVNDHRRYTEDGEHFRVTEDRHSRILEGIP